MTAPKSLIINLPYDYPEKHWVKGRGGSLEIVEGRRPASYDIFDFRNDTQRTEPLDLVNRIRTRVDEWRDADYPGTTSITHRLLEHWYDRDARQYPFYFCQLEAIETLIWHIEASPEYKQGIHIPGDGGAWERLCNKMATGTGKTAVMAMIITWQVLNALTYPRRTKDFCKTVFVVAPGLTVKERLHVLYPGDPANDYDAFNLCPNESLRQKLNQAEILVENWHILMPLKDPDRSVVKKGPETDEAFTRRVLGKLAESRSIIVINDEAHHAYRVRPEVKISKKRATEEGLDLDEATRWIDGLDRLHKTRRILRAFDLSATPFAPTGKSGTEKALFEWIISDYGLNDAIEGGLVKTPRIVVRDDALPDAKTLRPKLYHLYRDPEVSEDVNRKAERHEALPNLVKNAYTLLAADWREARQKWQAGGHKVPPVMLTVCNRTETAARIEHYFNSGDAYWPELKAPEKTLRVDSKVLDKAEVGEASSSDKDYEARLQEIVDAADIAEDRKARYRQMKKEELLREIVDNVGKRGTAGQDLQNVVSVAMLSEGWDAKNVTHIMGLRAFTSQLLCEQVMGRGLRRVSHEKDENGFFEPEYVNVFGVPLTLSIFEDVGGGGEAPPAPKPSTQIEALPERNAFEIRWPNVVRVETQIRPELSIEWGKVESLRLEPSQTMISAELAPAVGGATDLNQIREIDLEKIPEEFRLQRLVFQAARKAFDEMRRGFSGRREYLLIQLVRLVEEFLDSGKIEIPSLYHQQALRRRILVSMNMDLIVQHLLRHVREHNRERIEPIYDEEMPINSTRFMRTWFTTRPCHATQKSQISHMVADGTWEQHAANVLEKSDLVQAYAKNDHLGFHIYYLWNGARRRYVPDFLLRLSNSRTLVLEIKGQDSERNRVKRQALDEWVEAVNAKGGFGRWCSDVAFEPHEIQDILGRHVDQEATVPA